MKGRIMRRAALAAVVIAAATLASTAQAAVATVTPSSCAVFFGGSVTRPAGSTITVRQGIAEQERGILTAFLREQSATVSINGGAPVDLSRSWSDPAQPPLGGWVSFVEYPTGITLGVGDSLTIAFSVTLAHGLPEVLNPAGGFGAGQPAFNEPGTTTWTCTVTGV
jgi:hypothetical protein